MKILILTNKIHFPFVHEQYGKYCYDYELWVYADKINEFPKNYDVGISFMYQYKIPQKELSKTWINFHPGPLPKYKGRNLCYHALMNGEEYFGASVHYMDEGFDTGDIIEVCTFPISETDTADSLSKLTMEVSCRLFEDYLPRIAAGETFPRIKNERGTYYSKMPIHDEIHIDRDTERRIRAITYGPYYPKINIGGDIYKVVKE